MLKNTCNLVPSKEIHLVDLIKLMKTLDKRKKSRVLNSDDFSFIFSVSYTMKRPIHDKFSLQKTVSTIVDGANI